MCVCVWDRFVRKTLFSFSSTFFLSPTSLILSLSLSLSLLLFSSHPSVCAPLPRCSHLNSLFLSVPLVLSLSTSFYLILFPSTPVSLLVPPSLSSSLSPPPICVCLSLSLLLPSVCVCLSLSLSLLLYFPPPLLLAGLEPIPPLLKSPLLEPLETLAGFV